MNMRNPNSDFIQTWTMPEHICDQLINWYNTNADYQYSGTVGGGDFSKKGIKDTSVKVSTDIAIHPENLDKPFNEYRVRLQECLKDYINTYPKVDSLCKFNIVEPYNIQHYKKGEGFKKEHFERDGYNNRTVRRCLVFMTYLNDLDAGGTIFPYQNRTLKAQKGKTVIFPTDWTHTHVGQISETQEKTIVTGWYSYIWDEDKSEA
jgi:prolyl 4-hydroxylase